jgi:hypothetical protein
MSGKMEGNSTDCDKIDSRLKKRAVQAGHKGKGSLNQSTSFGIIRDLSSMNAFQMHMLFLPAIETP